MTWTHEHFFHLRREGEGCTLPSELSCPFNIISNEIISSHCIDGGVKTNSCKMRRRVTTSLISFLPWTAIVKVLVSVVIMICDSNYCCNISGKKSSLAVRCGRLLRDADKTAQSTMGKNNSIKFGKYVWHQSLRFVIQSKAYFLKAFCVFFKENSL